MTKTQKTGLVGICAIALTCVLAIVVFYVTKTPISKNADAQPDSPDGSSLSRKTGPEAANIIIDVRDANHRFTTLEELMAEIVATSKPGTSVRVALHDHSHFLILPFYINSKAEAENEIEIDFSTLNFRDSKISFNDEIVSESQLTQAFYDIGMAADAIKQTPVILLKFEEKAVPLKTVFEKLSPIWSNSDQFRVFTAETWKEPTIPENLTIDRNPTEKMRPVPEIKLNW